MSQPSGTPEAPKATPDTPTQDATGTEPKAPERKTVDLTQDELNALIGRTKADVEESVKKKIEADRAQELKAAEEAALVKNQEFQRLAETRGAELATISTEKATLQANFENTSKALERAEAALQTHLKTLKDGVPESVLKLLDSLDAPSQLEWLTENAATLKGKDDAPKTPPVGGKGVIPTTPASGAPSASASKLTDEEKRKRAMSIRDL